MKTSTTYSIGDVLQGYGLQNAGRYYTVCILKGKRMQLEEHLTGRLFWTFVSGPYRLS